MEEPTVGPGGAVRVWQGPAEREGDALVEGGAGGDEAEAEGAARPAGLPIPPPSGHLTKLSAPEHARERRGEGTSGAQVALVRAGNGGLA